MLDCALEIHPSRKLRKGFVFFDCGITARSSKIVIKSSKSFGSEFVWMSTKAEKERLPIKSQETACSLPANPTYYCLDGRGGQVMKTAFAVSTMIMLNLMSLPAMAQSFGYVQSNDHPWQDSSSARTGRGAVASNWNVYTRPGFNGDMASAALLAGQSVNPAPIRSGKFNLGFGGPNAAPHDLNPDDGGSPNGNNNQEPVVLPYTPGPDWAPVFNSHSGDLMGYMAPGETLQQFFSGQSGHILPAQAAEGLWILQNQLGGMANETASEFSGF